MSPLIVSPSRTPRTRRAGDAPLARPENQNGTPTKQHMCQTGAAEVPPRVPDRGTSSKPLPDRSLVPGKVPRGGRTPNGKARCPRSARADRTVIGVVADLPGRVENLPQRFGRQTWRWPSVNEAVGLRPGRLLPLRSDASRIDGITVEALRRQAERMDERYGTASPWNQQSNPTSPR
jgi:hypothetical protein